MALTPNKVADAAGSVIVAVMSLPAIIIITPLSIAGWIASKLSKK